MEETTEETEKREAGEREADKREAAEWTAEWAAREAAEEGGGNKPDGKKPATGKPNGEKQDGEKQDGEKKAWRFGAQMFDTTLSLNLNHVFPDWFIIGNDIGYHSRDNGGIRKKRQRHNAVLVSALDYIITRIILKDTYYVSPYQGSHRFYIRMGKKGDKETSSILRNKTKTYLKLDLVRTKGIIYEMHMFMLGMPEGRKLRRVRLGRKYWDAIIELVNNGKAYRCQNSFDTVEDGISHREVMDHVTPLFPGTPREMLSRTVIYGMGRVGRYSMMDPGVQFMQRQTKFLFRTYKHRNLCAEEGKRIQMTLSKTRRCRLAGIISPHKKLLQHLTWQRTKTVLKKAAK